jgi:hypothetical protein
MANCAVSEHLQGDAKQRPVFDQDQPQHVVAAAVERYLSQQACFRRGTLADCFNCCCCCCCCCSCLACRRGCVVSDAPGGVRAGLLCSRDNGDRQR